MKTTLGKNHRHSTALPSPSRVQWTRHALERLQERGSASAPSPERLWQAARFWGHRKTSYVWEAPGDLVLLSVPEAGRWIIVSVMPRRWFERQIARTI